MSPSPQELRDVVQRQKRQITRLQAKLDSAETDLQSVSAEKAELEQRFEQNADTLEKTTQMEADAGRACKAVTQQVRALIALCQNPNFRDDDIDEEEEEEERTSQEGQVPDALPASLQVLHHHVKVLSNRLTESAKQRQQLVLDSQTAKQTISELETQIRVLETEKASTDECNARYDKEREELGNAIVTLRSALDGMRGSLVSAEEEKKKLKIQNARLRLELEKLKA
jgi:chromosome segregation ATPase